MLHTQYTEQIVDRSHIIPNDYAVSGMVPAASDAIQIDPT